MIEMEFDKLLVRLSLFDLINLEQVLGSLAEQYQARLLVSGDKASWAYRLQQEFTIPNEMDMEFLWETPDQVEHRIGLCLKQCRADEARVYNASHRLVFSCASRDWAMVKSLITDLETLLKQMLPTRFLSMEHFLNYIGGYSRISLYELSLILLKPAMAVIDQVFESCPNRGTISFLNNREERAEKIKTDNVDGSVTYIEVNSYRVYEKDKRLLAVGISMEQHHWGKSYTLVVFTGEIPSDQINSLFGKPFEELLQETANLKGGKFTGDQRVIKLIKPLGLNDLVLDDEVEHKIENDLLSFFSMEPLYRQANLPFKRGIVLHGPPGTGKTSLVKVMVSTMQQTIIWVKTGDISCVEQITQIFRLARLGKPSVIIFEDVDFFLSDRDRYYDTTKAVANLMAELDGLEENDGIMVVMTTNRLDVLEKAIVERPGRIDERILIGKLCRDKVIELLERKLKYFHWKDFSRLSKVLPENLVLTGAMTCELATLIIKYALKESKSSQIEIYSNHIGQALRDLEEVEQMQMRRAGFAV
ncbi:AAA family ATPase [Syntrophomonas wolfei]|uniref:AAA family ATPase n=1 Tax=Syntrophomonas wolfei TaxID=863 RepID=UPI000772DEB4|nr:AAA family ATPase [Syntrophomonas wolfei]